MLLEKSASSRRRFPQQTSVIAACVAASALAQPGKVDAAQRSVSIAQLVDVSQAQQDVSKDFLTGSHAALQDINLRGGLQGRRVEYIAFETDGTPASLRAALDSVKSNPACMAMSGSFGSQLASEMVSLARQEGFNFAHVAPWLQSSVAAVDDDTFPIFAARREQITHAGKSLSVMGIAEIGAVYGFNRDYAAYKTEVERIASSMQLKLQMFQSKGNLWRGAKAARTQ